MRFTAPYQCPWGGWGAMALCIISDGFKTELEAWQWIAEKLSEHIDAIGDNEGHEPSEKGA